MNTTRLVLQLFVMLSLLIAVGRGAEAPAAAERSAGNAALTYWRAFALMPALDGDTDWAMRRSLTQFTPLDAKLAVVIRQSEAALAELRRAAGQTQCQWETPWDEGPDAKLPHLEKTRQLARLAALRMRQRCEEGQVQDAVDDLFPALLLARRTGADGPLLTLLLELSVERNLIEVSAAYLPELNPNQLDLVAERLPHLPPPRTVRAATQVENAVYTGWLLRVLGQWDGKERVTRLFEGSKNADTEALSALTREQLADAAGGLRDLYERLDSLAWDSTETLEACQRQVLENPALPVNVRHLANLVLPAVQSAQRTEDVYRVQWTMWKAALAVARQGPDALNQKEYREPLVDRPFTSLRWEHGFQLRAQRKDGRNNPVVLTVGRARAR